MAGTQQAFNKIMAIAIVMIKSTKVERGRAGIRTQVWVAPKPVDFPGCVLMAASVKVYTVRFSYLCVFLSGL